MVGREKTLDPNGKGEPGGRSTSSIGKRTRKRPSPNGFKRTRTELSPGGGDYPEHCIDRRTLRGKLERILI